MLYDVIVYTSTKYKYEIEAENHEAAGEKAEELCQESECPDVINDVDVSQCDCQYTDHQEIADREEGLYGT